MRPFFVECAFQLLFEDEVKSWSCVCEIFIWELPEPVGCCLFMQVENDARSSAARTCAGERQEDKAISVAHLIFSQFNFITASLGTKVGLQSQLSICLSIQNGRRTTFRNPAALLALQKRKCIAAEHTSKMWKERRSPYRVKEEHNLFTYLIQPLQKAKC